MILKKSLLHVGAMDYSMLSESLHKCYPGFMIVHRSVEGCPYRNASKIPPQVNETLKYMRGVQNLMICKILKCTRSVLNLMISENT